MSQDWAELSVVVHPSGRLGLRESGNRLSMAVADRLRRAIADGESELFFQLATGELQTALPADFAYLREYARELLTALCHTPAGDGEPIAMVPAPSAEQLVFYLMRAPAMVGCEYLSAEVLSAWWHQLREHIATLAGKEGGLAALLAERSPQWRMVGRVTFHLAENKKDSGRPFAFVATYTSRLSAAGRPQHLPLARALQEYAGAGNRAALLKLLLPVNEAAGKSQFVKELVDGGAIYRASAWTMSEAYRFLQEIPAMESAGLLIRVPDWWKGKRPARPKVSVSIGASRKTGLSFDALMDFDVSVTLEGQSLSEEEVRQLLQSESGLVQLRGQWVELDHAQLQAALDRWREIEQHAHENGVSFHQAMRLLAGGGEKGLPEEIGEAQREWVGLSAGEWLADALKRLRSPEQSANAQHPALQATLRPYQLAGVSWLRFVAELGLGACLADDMGLGKTIQVITLLLHLKDHATGPNVCSILVAPASLLGNWRSELSRFAPSLRAVVAHPAELSPEQFAELKREPERRLADVDLLITTYGMLGRESWLCERPWKLAILDEAQAIKNATTRQAQMARKLKATSRVALTGTPVENRLGDLWSLFEFLNPGLLGSAKEFTDHTKRLAAQERPNYLPLRTIIKPYILRRLKTDKTIISDLPDKTEMKAFCPLSRRQAALYKQTVNELERQLDTADGIQRKGLILATLLRLKQICNHPAQFVGDEQYDAEASGKFGRLREICDELAQRQQKVLVFSQFREITGPLSAYLQAIFGRPGLVLSGETPVAKRKEMVDAFQQEDGPPFFVLSIKAGGTGLNLTAASVVIHFDRWWNPAVENQATDRAFRIGQKNNVLVHKFVCQGTVEERIDSMIEEKLALSSDILDGGGERLLTEMNDKELVGFLSLDLARATES